ncbi:hypothetical protein SISNIDRAFT_466593 [Sistotremastrum niveocremeum HHB9708]|uniref:T6SS Phospholipase effector Tle1-like catalytic domain-containing protein n=1 Tax=Sistotremastrum niveocremeum HHB9708 TaxID=1314777 RepID=A0A164TWN7_9AGAM|nr:hypothetical protein SISNIDRAFT_466593 [Sistotremastrum niveocremeum HHB9708]
MSYQRIPDYVHTLGHRLTGTDSHHALIDVGLDGPNGKAAPESPPARVEANQIIPPTVPLDETCWPPITKNRPRTLVLCFDGTGDQNSNIVRIFQCLKKNDPTRQMVYYQPGIGTYVDPTMTGGALKTYVASKLDEAVAWYFHAHVKDGYEFLMDHYVAGDRICLFGFSRGAYTARALAGMVHSVGLLPQANKQQVPFAWKFYSENNTPEGLIKASEFKAAFSNNVIIDFVGVFDTVASVGLFSKELPFATSNRAIRIFRHALALDERRVKFKANHFHNPPKPLKAETERKIKAHQITGSLKQSEATAKITVIDPNAPSTRPKKAPTDHKEVWFAGCHCDVGGGSVKNDVKTNLAMIPLRWMIKETIETETGILFDLAQLSLLGLTPVLPSSPTLILSSEVVPKKELPRLTDVWQKDEKPLVPSLENLNAVEHKTDQIDKSWFWRFLEWIPFKVSYLNDEGVFVTTDKRKANHGKGRTIPNPKNPGYPLYIHQSVQYRWNNFEYVDAPLPSLPGSFPDEGRKRSTYKPKAIWLDELKQERELDFADPDLKPFIHWVE